MKDRQMTLTDGPVTNGPLTDELYTPKEVCHIFKVTKNTLFMWVTSGRFPPPRKLYSAGDNRWTGTELNKVLETMPVATAYKDCGYQEGERA